MGAQSNHSQCHAGVDSSQLCMIEYCCRINNYYQYVHKSVQVKEVLRESCHEDVVTHIVLACYLIQKGANIFIKNIKGETPLNRLPIDEVALIAKFCEQLKVVSV